MRIIKIGSSSNCDIVLHSTYVSALHAEITLLDSGEIIIEDKRSTNGTFVGNQRLQPGVETRVRRGDYVRFADVELVWGQVPGVENNMNYKRVINIGSNYRNDIVVNAPGVSRFHASVKIDKKNNVFIADNHSVNGVFVNGNRIQSGRLSKISRKDSVMCGNEDITMLLRPYFKSSFPAWLGWTAGVTGIAAVIAALLFFLLPSEKSEEDIYNKYKDAVVYVHAGFRYTVYYKDYPDLCYTDNEVQVYTGTAFFVDRDGRMCTNRHVAAPWESFPAERGHMKSKFEAFRKKQIPVDRVDTEEDLHKLYSTEWGREIIELTLGQYAEGEYSEDVILEKLNIMVQTLRNAEIVISGEHTSLGIGYSSEYYSNNQYEPAHLLCASKHENVDVAFIRLDSKKTPDKVKNVIDVNNAVTTHPNVNDEFHVMGYPGGRAKSVDEISKSLEVNYKRTRCCKEPNRYIFQLEHGVAPGASGSPVLDNSGRLCGVAWGTTSGNDAVTYVNHARFIKELYDNEVR